MRIAIVSKLWETSDVCSTGGTGVLVGNLVKGLIKRGHDVTLFATKNTKTKAKLISVVDKPFSKQRQYSEIKEFLNISLAFQMANKFDIINCHNEYKSLLFSNIVKTPVAHTLGYGEFFGDEMDLLKQYKKEPFIVVSKAMAENFKFLNIQSVIYNGLDFNLFPFNNNPKDYFLFLARMSPQKGPDIAIKAVKSVGAKLILAGKISGCDSDYLRKKVFPYIDGKNIKYVGEVGFNKKINLIKNARALLHPHKYFEAFGISLIESQACGTPVITFPNGASPEVMSHNKTGYVVKNLIGIKSALNKIDKINRIDCRNFVKKNFSFENMAIKYEKIYKKLIKAKKNE